MQCPVIAGNRVFVGAETIKVIVNEVSQLSQRAGAGGRPSVGWGHAELDGNKLVDLVALVLEVWRPGVVFRGRKAIVGIEVPAATIRLSVGDHDAEPNSLGTIEVLHDKGLLAIRPQAEVWAGG